MTTVPPPGDQGAGAYPVGFSVDYPDRPPNRVTTAFRLILMIPIAIVLGLVANAGWQGGDGGMGNGRVIVLTAGGLLFLAPLLMILFRRKYPRW